MFNKRSKKASVEVQFNWIYMGVIGGIMLLVMVSVVIGIMNNAKNNFEADVIGYFDKAFTSLQGNENTEHSISMPGFDIEVDNYDDNCYYYRIKGSDRAEQSTRFMPIFSPDLIKKNLLSYSLAWDMPFRTTYFLYVTSPDIAYVFVNDLSSQQFYDDLPEHMTKYLETDPEDFEDQKYYKIKFISFTDDPSGFELDNSVINMKDTDVSAIFIEESGTSIYDGGSVSFYQKEGNAFELVKESYYTDKATLFAALYSENAAGYECNLREKALKRMNHISEMLVTRINDIEDGLLDHCSSMSGRYDEAKSILEDIAEITQDPEMTQQKIVQITQKSKELQEINEELNRRACPTIY